MWDNRGTGAARKNGVQKARRNRTTATLAAVTLCAALAVSGCGSGSGVSHGSHAVATSASGSDGHSGHGAGDDTKGSANGSAHDGHEARDNESNSNPAGSHEDHGSDSSGREQANEYALAYTIEPQHPAAGEPFAIDMNITDGDGNAIEKFDITHEKLMHLIVVSEDLSQFYHLHPDYDGKSGFRQEAELPEGGSYRLFADYKPAGGEARTAIGNVHVAGTESIMPLKPDTNMTTPRKVDGMNVSLALTTLKAGEEAELTFSFEDAATGEAVSDLEPYLGAIGHVVIVSEGAQKYLHVHAETDNGSGPEATFATQFPEPGLYRIWGQFQREGKLITVSYTVKAE